MRKKMKAVLDARVPIALYHQLKQVIRQGIESGEWRPGDVIPSERELATELGLSRATVRQAVGDLVKEGVLARVPGKGTFVAPPKPEQGLLKFYSFAETSREWGLTPRAEVLELANCLPPTAVSRALGLGKDDFTVKLVRVRYAGEQPFILETSYLPSSLFPGLIEVDLSATPLYEALATRYGVKVMRARESFEPVLIDEYESTVLGVPQGSPALLIERLAFSHAQIPVELCKGIVRGDKCRYYVELGG